MSVTLTIVKADVVALAPELDDALIVTADWTRTIGWAGDEMSPSLGVQARLNRCGTYLVAHMIFELLQMRRGLQGGGLPGGPLTAVTVDKISKTFGSSDAWKNTAITAAVLQTTAYGREYLRLIRLFIGVTAQVAGGLGPIGPGTGWPNS